MRPAVLTLAILAAAAALAPRSTAQDSIEITALAPSGMTPSAFTAAPFVGVERGNAFRLAERRVGLFAPKPEPLPFSAQLRNGLSAVHLAVYADPGPGRYARGAARGESALGQPGLKVIDPEAPDGEAVCATLMLCLTAVDTAAQRAEGPIALVIDARRAPRPEPLLLRVAAALVDTPPPAPTWEALFAEIATALPRIDPDRFVLIVAGGRGEIPDRAAVFGAAADSVLIDGLEARVLRADASPEAVGESVMSGAATVVVGADWAGEGDPDRLGPREAAALGAHVVLVTPRTARAEADPS